MAIIGLTVSESGEAIQRLAVTTKVAIGEVVRTANGTRPNKLDHFIFLRKSTKLEWELDQELVKHYGHECREFWIILLDDEIENVFRTEYAWWSRTEKKCWGDGREATRRTEKAPEGEDWTPCGDACPDLNAGTCKPSGDLYFVLAEFPRLGALCRLHTTSYRSIRQIHSALEQIRTVTGGRLAGIRCKLVVRPEKAAYMDTAKGKKVSTTIYALNIELSAQDMNRLVSTMTEHAKLFEQTKKLLGSGRKVELVAEDEPETERAPDVAQEFYPENETAVAPAVQQPTRRSEAVTPEVLPAAQPLAQFINAEQRRAFYTVCVEAGWGNEQVRTILQGTWGIKSSAEIPVSVYDDLIRQFKSCKIEGPTDKFEASNEDIPF
ncbi:MAG: hypothetical protein ABSF14_19720 [Terriglobia bacterium]|jgi:hypothetical protein